MRRDFEKFFTKLQLDYNVLLKQKEKIDKEFGENLLTKKQYESFLNYYNAVKTNYDRVHYVRYLLHKPPKFIETLYEKWVKKDIMKDLKQFSDNKADEESVLAENSKMIESIENEFYE